MSAWTDIWDVIKGVNAAGTGNFAGAEQAAVSSPATQAAGNATGAWGAITGFLLALTDWHLWASLGWLLLGLVLIVMGARLWLGKSALPAPPAVIPV